MFKSGLNQVIPINPVKLSLEISTNIIKHYFFNCLIDKEDSFYSNFR